MIAEGAVERLGEEGIRGLTSFSAPSFVRITNRWPTTEISCLCLCKMMDSKVLGVVSYQCATGLSESLEPSAKEPGVHISAGIINTIMTRPNHAVNGVWTHLAAAHRAPGAGDD